MAALLPSDTDDGEEASDPTYTPSASFGRLAPARPLPPAAVRVNGDDVGRENYDEDGAVLNEQQIDVRSPLRPLASPVMRIAASVSRSPSASSPSPADGHEERVRTLVLLVIHQDENTRKSPWNRLTALFCGSDIIHCELFFLDEGVTCTLDSRRPVTFMAKQYARNAHPWEAWAVDVSPQGYAAAWSFCRAHLGGSFDSMARWTYPLYTCLQVRSADRWLCSRLVGAALVHAGVAPVTMDVDRATPSTIYRMLRQLGHAGDLHVRQMSLHRLDARSSATAAEMEREEKERRRQYR